MKKPLGLVGSLLLGLSINAWSSSLLDLYYETMASDPRIQRAESEAAIYQARERGSLGRLLPQAQVGAQGTRTVRESTGLTGEDRDYYFGERYFFSLTQPLYDKSSWEAFRSAAKESDQFSARFVSAKSIIAVDMVDRYTQVLAAEDNYAFVTEERKAAEEQLKLIRARYERQLSSITDLLSVEARTNVLRSRELDAQNEVFIARENMSEILGREVNEPFSKLRPGLLPVIDLGFLEEWIHTGLSNNADLKASKYAVKSAKARVREAAGRRHPTLGLTLSAQKSDIGFENAQTPIAETYVAAVNVTMPLFSGGQVSAQIAETRARLRMAEKEYQQVERGLRRDIRQAFLNTRSAIERVEATRKAVESAEKSYEAQQKGLKFGTVTVVDVLNSSETLFESRRDHRQAFYDLMVQSMTLYQVSGQFNPEKISSIDAWLIDVDGQKSEG